MVINEKDQPWVVEWSERENCFYLQTLSDALDRNQATYFEGSRCVHYPLAILPSADAARHVAEIFAEQREFLRECVDPPPEISEVMETTRDIIQSTLDATGYESDYCRIGS